MKILRIIYDWPPPWHGLSPHPYELTVAQLRQGHNVTVWGGRWPSNGPIERPGGIEVKGFFREPLPGTLNITTSVLLFIYYLFWRRSNTVDIIHAHGHFGIWIYLYRLFLRRFFKNSEELKIPLVAHFHNTVEGRKQAVLGNGIEPKVHSKYLSWPLARLSDKWAVKVASACIFVSERVRDEAIEYYGADPQKCFVVESGVNTELFHPIGAEEREKTRVELGLDNLDKIVVNNGTMVERKNIHLLVESLKYLPVEYKVLLVGPGDKEYLMRIDGIVANLNLGNRVIKVDYTPYPQIPIAFQAADLFVLPSSWEGTPKVVMQSIACGVPALVSGFKLSEDISGLHYLEEVTAERIAKSIQFIVENSGHVDRSKVITLYSWNKKAEEVEKVYEYIRQNQN
jgi:glycosyltransferase involved in cell wall biosynthesis